RQPSRKIDGGWILHKRPHNLDADRQPFSSPSHRSHGCRTTGQSRSTDPPEKIPVLSDSSRCLELPLEKRELVVVPKCWNKGDRHQERIETLKIVLPLLPIFQPE